MSLKESILKLRNEGHTYSSICTELNCCMATVSYYCNPKQKEQKLIANRLYRKKQHPYHRKLSNFLGKSSPKSNRVISSNNKTLLYSKILSFQRIYKGKIMVNNSGNISLKDIIEKFGEHPKCYLTGVEIDIYKPKTYQFDHIIPRTRGGQNTLDNMGICTKEANLAKRDMTPDEFINLCKMVVENHK